MTSGDSVTYVAPARYVLTVLHRKDPDAGPGKDAEGEPVTGWTVCGLGMGTDELWQPVERRDGDRVCEGCSAPGVQAPAGDVEVTLW